MLRTHVDAGLDEDCGQYPIRIHALFFSLLSLRFALRLWAELTYICSNK